jgi:AcrR family transcriptional regulator
MGVKERRARERSQVREKILDAALDFFAREGAEGMTMRALAEAIEYSPPVIYAHFRDKEAIIKELCHRQLRGLAKAFTAFGHLNPLERLRRIGYVYADSALEHPSHFRFMFLTMHAVEPVLDHEARNDPETHAYAFFKKTVEEAIAADLLRPEYADAEEVVQMCWASAHGLVALHNVKGASTWIDWRDPRTTAHKLVDAVVDGIAKLEAIQPAARTAARRAPERRRTR